MNTADKIAYLWNKALEDAIGAGQPDPFAYADDKVKHLRAEWARASRTNRGRG